MAFENNESFHARGDDEMESSALLRLKRIAQEARDERRAAEQERELLAYVGAFDGEMMDQALVERELKLEMDLTKRRGGGSWWPTKREMTLRRLRCLWEDMREERLLAGGSDHTSRLDGEPALSKTTQLQQRMRALWRALAPARRSRWDQDTIFDEEDWRALGDSALFPSRTWEPTSFDARDFETAKRTHGPIGDE